MKKPVVCIFVCLVCCCHVRAQDQLDTIELHDSLVYDLFGEAHALMCPFLSPQLQKRLENEGGRSFIKTKDLHLIFKVAKSNPISQERIMQLVDRTGYESKNFSVVISEAMRNE